MLYVLGRYPWCRRGDLLVYLFWFPQGQVNCTQITPNIPIMPILIVVATVFSMVWCKTVMQHFHAVYLEYPTCPLYFLGVKTLRKYKLLVGYSMVHHSKGSVFKTQNAEVTRWCYG